MLAVIFLGVGLILVGITIIMTWPEGGPGGGYLESKSNIADPVEVDYRAPALTLIDLAGNEQTLKDYRGQVVLVNLWATWCPPCKAEMPVLKAYYEAHRSDGFVIIAINDGDPRASVEDFVDAYDLTFPVWLDPTYEATERAFKTLNLPSSFVIDRNGKVRLRWVGETDLETLEEFVTPLVNE